jgi:hypothetical protein
MARWGATGVYAGLPVDREEKKGLVGLHAASMSEATRKRQRWAGGGWDAKMEAW